MTAWSVGIEEKPGEMAPLAVVMIEACPLGIGMGIVMLGASEASEKAAAETAVVVLSLKNEAGEAGGDAAAAATVTPVWSASVAGIEEKPGTIAPSWVVMMGQRPLGTGCEPVGMGIDMVSLGGARPAPH